MKITLVTASSQEYMPLAKLTHPSKLKYAMKHGYNFMPCVHADPHRISWERVNIWKHVLPGSDWIFFTGCDVAITNLDIKLESFISDDCDFIFAVDRCGLQSDSWIMRNCEATRQLLDKVLSWEGKLQNEQDAMTLELSNEKIFENYMASLPEARISDGTPPSPQLIDWLKETLNRSPVRCKVVSQRELNAYPMNHYNGTGEESWSWHPGDFIAHIPGKSLEYRLKAFQELLKESSMIS